ncbi:MAG TPA: rubrerythrin family protein [Geobacteraceae bacterium]|nr:rubrerythrin family protein [Geobacteraceae bacterium]
MKSFSETKTETNILTTYQTEARDCEIYRACGEEAELEGNHQVANLFRAASASENIHAHSLLMALRETSRATCDLWKAGGYDPRMVKDSSAENLKEAIANVTSEFSELYPGMIRDAENDGWSFAKQCFTYARAVNEVHCKLFKKALHNPDKKGSVDYYVCESCGNTIEKKPVGSCKVCGSSESAFMTVK